MHSLSSAFAPWNPILANVCGLLLLFPPPVGTGVLVLVVVVAAGVGSTTLVGGAAEETGKGLGVPVVVVDGVGGTAPGSFKFNLNFAAAPALTAEGLGLQSQLDEQGSDLCHQRVQVSFGQVGCRCGMGVDRMNRVFGDYDCSSVSCFVFEWRKKRVLVRSITRQDQGHYHPMGTVGLGGGVVALEAEWESEDHSCGKWRSRLWRLMQMG